MKLLILLLVICAFFITAILIMEDSMIYFPARYPEGNWDIKNYGVIIEDAYFETTDGLNLHGWFVPSNENKITLLWFHGNAGNLSHRLDNLLLLHKLNINIFIFDYRSYGKSEGKIPSEKTIYIDARAAYHYLIQERGIPKENLILFGRSLGGALAVETAKEFGCKGLIIESSFPSAKEMAGKMFPLFPVKFLIKTKYNSAEKIKKIHCPKLFIHGNQDDIVPIKLGKMLFKAAMEPKEFYEIDRSNHNDTYITGGDDYFERINQFLRKLTA